MVETVVIRGAQMAGNCLKTPLTPVVQAKTKAILLANHNANRLSLTTDWRKK